MGILDDAIREHLELKRQLGAREAEVKRLEDEAFGPSARPGESEFGEAATQGDDAGEPFDKAASDAARTDVQAEPPDPVATDLQEPDASALEPHEPNDDPVLIVEERVINDPFYSPEEIEELGAGADAVAPTSDPPVEAAPPQQHEAAAADPQPPLPSEPSPPPIDALPADTTEAPPSDIEIEDFEVGDLNLAIDEDPEFVADEDDDGDGLVTAGAEGGASPPDQPIADTAESPFDFVSFEDEAVEAETSAPPTETYADAPETDRTGNEGAEGFEAAPAEGGPTTDDETPPAVQEAPAAREPDSGWLPELAESDDRGSTEADVQPAAAPSTADDPQPADPDPAPAISETAPEEDRPADERVEQGEDVLEETPEFLRDVPESDHMWFEQGEPQDFDFDDEN